MCSACSGGFAFGGVGAALWCWVVLLLGALWVFCLCWVVLLLGALRLFLWCWVVLLLGAFGGSGRLGCEPNHLSCLEFVWAFQLA